MPRAIIVEKTKENRTCTTYLKVQMMYLSFVDPTLFQYFIMMIQITQKSTLVTLKSIVYMHILQH